MVYSIPLKDFVAIMISAASFCFAIAAFLRTNSEQRRRLILDQVTNEIAALEELSVEIVRQVECILLSSAHSDLSSEDAYIQTQHEFRKAELRLANLEFVLKTKADAIHRQYVDWHRALTSDRYPVSSREHCYQVSDERFLCVGRAQAVWRRYLFTLRLLCLHYQIKFWKK